MAHTVNRSTIARAQVGNSQFLPGSVQPDVLPAYGTALDDQPLADTLLTPTQIYCRPIKALLAEVEVKSLAHITGGGLVDNVARILPPGVTALFRSGSWTVPPIFRLIQERGPVDRAEMFRVFNMGIGMVLVCSPDCVDRVLASVESAGLVGEVAESRENESVLIE